MPKTTVIGPDLLAFARGRYGPSSSTLRRFLRAQFGERTAEGLGNLNENARTARGEQDPNDRARDQERNRSVGRSIGDEISNSDCRKTCQEDCMDAWNDGRLPRTPL